MTHDRTWMRLRSKKIFFIVQLYLYCLIILFWCTVQWLIIIKLYCNIVHCSALQYSVGIAIFASALPRLSSVRASRITGLLLSLFRLSSVRMYVCRLLVLLLRVAISCHIVRWGLLRRLWVIAALLSVNWTRRLASWPCWVVCSVLHTHLLPLVMLDHYHLLLWYLHVLRFSLTILRGASQTRCNQTDWDKDEHHLGLDL